MGQAGLPAPPSGLDTSGGLGAAWPGWTATVRPDRSGVMKVMKVGGCQWCGGQLRQKTGGRPAVFCGASCRQRAYEARRQAAGGPARSLKAHFADLRAKLAEINSAPGASPFAKSGAQLGAILIFYRDASGGDTEDQPLLQLFEAISLLAAGGKPPLLSKPPRPRRGGRPVSGLCRLKRAYIAAAADVLMAAGHSRHGVLGWTEWRDEAQAKNALRQRDKIMADTQRASLAAQEFHKLRPDLRRPTDRAEAERLARGWLKAVARLGNADPEPK